MLAFLDMDGVLTDFVGAACRAHGKSNPYDDAAAQGVWAMETLWGMSGKEFWAPCNGEGFWDRLEKTPEADDIVKLITDTFGVENVALLTAPSMSGFCIPEKRLWIRRNYPQLEGGMIFTAAKKFLAGPDRLLIDDRDKNIEDFRLFGGKAVTVPRPWNRMHALSDKPLEVLYRVLGGLQEFLDESEG
jgi:5'(3')-deoxyribonucleotidase